MDTAMSQFLIDAAREYQTSGEMSSAASQGGQDPPLDTTLLRKMHSCTGCKKDRPDSWFVNLHNSTTADSCLACRVMSQMKGKKPDDHGQVERLINEWEQGVKVPYGPLSLVWNVPGSGSTSPRSATLQQEDVESSK